MPHTVNQKTFRCLLLSGSLFFLSVMLVSGQETPTETAPEAATADVGLADVGSPTEDGFRPPKVTPIKGGFYLEWPMMTSVGGVRLTGPLSGRYEIQFDLGKDDIGKPPTPVSEPEIILPLADYWIVRGKPEKSIPLYRLGLDKDPGNLLFLNNLAMLLSSVEGKHNEALGLIDGALEDKRDNVTLLDSKGLILMKDGRPDEAIPHLERAVELSCQLPIYCLHLAKALDMAGRENSARNWFDKARPLLEATPGKLIRENKDMFDELRMKYAPPVAQ